MLELDNSGLSYAVGPLVLLHNSKQPFPCTRAAQLT